MKFDEDKNYSTKIMEAMKGGDEKEIAEAMNQFSQQLIESLKNDYQEARNDTNILAQRGYRVLTSQETKFYEKFIEAAKSSNPKQALTDLLTTHGMPETIIEDVYRDLKETHPLLAKINFKYVKYLTSWLLNNDTSNTAVWGEINAEIVKQIESSFKSVELPQGKLSAFAIIALDMLELGPTFMDAYIRTILKEALANGLEYGIVKGKGVKGEPIGLNRNISDGVEFNTTNGYPIKDSIKVTSFSVKNYCNLIADNLAKKENGKIRDLTGVTLLVNPIDYLKKIIPATTVRATDGTFKNDLFPFPTDVIKTKALDEGEAILCVLSEYFFGLGISKDAQIEYSDQFKFLEDKRAYKIKMFGSGRAEDNTSAVLLDITTIDPAYITVKQEVTA